MIFDDRVRVHAALGDPHRLHMADALAYSDLSFSELSDLTGLPGNALAHHLGILESAGLVRRRPSEGDKRRRYVQLVAGVLESLPTAPMPTPDSVLFVCTHNSARSQFAAAWWKACGAGGAWSAGLEPAERVHPAAARIAGEFGVDIAASTPRGYASITERPGLIISVCDRAREGEAPVDAPALHWSIADPVPIGTDEAFRSAFGEMQRRIDALTRTARPVH